MQTFLVVPKKKSDDEVTPPLPSERVQAPELPWYQQEATSSSSNEISSSLKSLYERRITGSPRIVVLSGRDVRFSSPSSFFAGFASIVCYSV